MDRDDVMDSLFVEEDQDDRGEQCIEHLDQPRRDPSHDLALVDLGAPAVRPAFHNDRRIDVQLECTRTDRCLSALGRVPGERRVVEWIDDRDAGHRVRPARSGADRLADIQKRAKLTDDRIVIEQCLHSRSVEPRTVAIGIAP